MIAGGENRLPFGNLPRLLLAWVCSEAVRTQSRDLVLGRSLYEFMHKLGMEDRSGGLHGERARLKNQMDRLFTSSVQLIYAADDHKVVVSSFVAERAEFWWNTKRPEAPSLWNSTIQLGERFFQEIHRAPDPARHAHSARPQAVAARVGFVFLARVQNLRAAPAAYALLGVSSIDSSAQARRTAGRRTSTAFGGRSCASSKKSNGHGRAWAIAPSRAGWSSSRRRLVSSRHSFTSSASRCAPRLRWSSVPLGLGGGSEGYPGPGLMKRSSLAASERRCGAFGRLERARGSWGA